MSGGEVTLRAAPVVISRLNPQTQTYVKIGKVPICAVRVKGNFILLLINGTKPFMSIPVTPNIVWTLQNDTYCNYTDPKQNIFLFQFENGDEARLFSGIALYQKLVQTKQPVLIAEGDKGVIDATNLFNVNFAAYDLLMSSKITEPIRKEENFSISSFDDTPIKQVAGGQYGSIFLVLFAPGVIAIVDPVNLSSSLPGFGFSSTISSSSSAAQAKEEEAPKKEKKKKTHKKGRKDSSASVSDLTDSSMSSTATKKPKVEEKHEEEEEELPFDGQLDDIKKTIGELYEKTKAEVASLYRIQYAQSSIPPSDDDLVSSLQRLIQQNAERRLVIEEKDNLIELLRSRDVDTSEVEKIRMQIGEATTKLIVQKKENAALSSKIAELKAKLEEGESKLIQARVDAEAQKVIAKTNIEMKKEQRKAELQSTLEDLKWAVQKEEKRLGETRKSFEFQKSESIRIAKAHEEDFSDDIKKMQSELEIATQKMKNEFAEGLNEMIEQSFEKEKEYPKDMALRAVRKGIQEQVDDLLGNDYDDEEDEEEE